MKLLFSDICDQGCVESQALLDYEDQFSYDSEVIYVRQVHSELDIPQRAVAGTRSMGPMPSHATLNIPNPAALSAPNSNSNIKSLTKNSNGETTSTSYESDKSNGKDNSTPVLCTNGINDISDPKTVSNGQGADISSKVSCEKRPLEMDVDLVRFFCVLCL